MSDEDADYHRAARLETLLADEIARTNKLKPELARLRAELDRAMQASIVATPAEAGWSQWNANVDALVKAASKLVKQAKTCAAFMASEGYKRCFDLSEDADEAAEALKPFEGK